jgi:adenylate cyclase
MPSFPFTSFPAELEREFQRYYAEYSAPVARLGALLGATLYLIFLFWDMVIDPAVAWKTVIIRSLVSAYFIGCWILLRQKSLLFLMQAILSVGVCVGGIGVVVIISLMHDGLTVGLSGLVLTLMFNFGFLRLLFWPSLVAGVIMVLAYNVAGAYVNLAGTLLITNNFFLVSALVAGASITYTLEKLFRRQFLNEKEIRLERAKADALLDNIIPHHIAHRLKAGERIVAESHGEATVLFADLVGFTSLTKRLSPNHLIELLNDIFSILDELTEKHGVEKVKTVGDAYMAVSGVDGKLKNSAEAIADFALDMVKAIGEYAKASGYPIAMRVGIATGQLISGVIGIRKVSFDLWGETVNLASRMETHSEQGSIQVTETTYWRLHNHFELIPKGKLHLEGFGPTEAYILVGRRTVPADARATQSTISFPDGSISPSAGPA